MDKNMVRTGKVLKIPVFLMLLIAVIFCGRTNVAVRAANSDFEIRDGVLVRYYGQDEKVTIPKSVTSIGDYAFDDCTSLKLVTYGGTKKEFVKKFGLLEWWFNTNKVKFKFSK